MKIEFIGDRRRKSRYNPDLARIVNKEVRREAEREKREEKS